MGLVCWVVIVATTLGVEPVALTNAHDEVGQAMRVTVESRGEAPDPVLVAQLRERLAYGFHEPSAERALTVELVWEQGVEIAVREGEEVWAKRLYARPVDANARVATLLAMWLFVRSTLTRAAEHLPAGSRARVVSHTTSAEEERPVPTAPAWNAGAALAAGVASRGSWSLGVLAQASRVVQRWVRVGCETGYLLTPGLRDLTVHEVPLAASVALRWPGAEQVSVGLLGALRGKYAVSDAAAAWSLGAALGPVVESRASLVGRQAGERQGALVLRAGFVWQLVRQRYVLPERTVIEPPWALSVALGVAL